MGSQKEQTSNNIYETYLRRYTNNNKSKPISPKSPPTKKRALSNDISSPNPNSRQKPNPVTPQRPNQFAQYILDEPKEAIERQKSLQSKMANSSASKELNSVSDKVSDEQNGKLA
eukprot:CAMPEP_0178975556 /NCGR_PEP_ID=MMETSP0789-20121207/23240_1 /TAXON_ID=3005 /ORGANISM="Rhizosolenia setigera, Strain CCMP 1694" /LENGTH=114 /DNA_ID=CAMNT_0020664339 /DNA_START=45 /DNA_END=385 /DNA_ORIENTATION=-